MDLDFDLTNNRLQLLSEDELMLKYRSRELCRLRFTRQGTAELLPSGGGIALFLIYDGAVVAEVVTWTTPASAAGWYEGTLILHTDLLETAFVDVATLEITTALEIHRWASGDVETPHISDESLMAKIRRPEIEPEPSSPVTLSGAEAWLTARAVRFDEEQELTTEQQATARANIGVTSGVSDHGALEGLADDDHPQYLNQTRGDARYPLASAMTSALAGKEPLQTLATQAEMEAGTVTDPRRMTPALIAAAIAALAAGGTPITLPLAVAEGGTGSETGDDARLALGIEEIIAAVEQVTTITVITDADTGWNNNGYIDVAEPSGQIRIWFNVDGMGSAPAATTERLIEVSLNSLDAVAVVAEQIAIAVDNDDAFIVSYTTGSNQLQLTCAVAGLAGAATTSTNTSIATANVDQAGADAYRRLKAVNGEQLSGVDAEKLGGMAANEFAAWNHVHSYTQITNRPQFANTSTDLTSTSTTLTNLLSLSVVSGKTYSFRATGTLSTSATTEGSSIAINGPTSSGIQAVATLPTNGIGGLTNGNLTAYATKFTNVGGPGTTARGRWEISGRFTAAANGTFAIRVSAETGGANSVTFHAGSVLELTPTN